LPLIHAEGVANGSGIDQPKPYVPEDEDGVLNPPPPKDDQPPMLRKDIDSKITEAGTPTTLSCCIEG
jgi:hypothetical protein